ncbi:acetyl-/propionyl-CoA carboxylase subunit alpha [Bifidobacterium callitrichos]|uniref:Acetyl-/propionyl-CoA carboxylase subunit alpha n=1 Tax=Bifidobacterium callitrichos TaxID=762209 RepID=A0A2T3GBJ3_9BIFI|nr:biotin carboxylase N-terminal domain-containing protein [Bifidobacterium callitrichos]PST46829.1 acetyl-/propionyl-CoA carboxylase subunit alpha [Bifidobacterium callitrichos]
MRINRILIANRGEIAVRIIHACHDTERTAIAVYADPDADALFVHLADEAYALGGETSKDTYLNIGAIIAAARKAHADAVHPGYGFLSENADFAQAVIDAGMTWIGPSPETIRMLGSKVEARRIAAEVGAPMAPGTTAPVHDPKEVVAFAREHGLPLAIKAVYGGGGRGLKVVHELKDVEEAFLSATHEAEVAFGNGDCFIERFLARPRHVEVQVLGDRNGRVVAVGTRDCSLQRRNQKLIEEAPAPFLSSETTVRLERAAVAICERAGYTSAGTVEFLVDPDGTMSFMEVNTRIQVEHPVTEVTTGVDLVAAQFAIAEGASIGEVVDAVAADGVAPIPAHGHAIEFRINAEDPSRGFVPFPGVVESLRTPSGPGVRFDTGIAAGSIVPDQFDSMLAKLIVWAPTRQECLVRARRALAELEIDGVPTVKAFDERVLADPDFTAIGDGEPGAFRVYTRWIEEVLLPHVDPATLASGSPKSRGVAPRNVTMWIELDGRRMRLGVPAGLAGLVDMAGALPEAAGAGLIAGLAGPSTATGNAPDTARPAGAIASTITGTVVRWLADDGATVAEGDPVVVVEAMKMETEIAAPIAGTVRQQAKPGDAVRFDDVLGEVVPGIASN